MSKQRFFVSGAQGFLGSWVIKNLLDLGHDVTAFDVDDRPVRLSLLLPPEELDKVKFVCGDICDLELVKGLLEQRAITHVIHLAGLLTPDCQATPVLGATVNILGTLTILEAARLYEKQVKCVAYASSAAVMGLEELYDSLPVKDGAPRIPTTLYGVFKMTTEECARIYWQDYGIRTVGLRPPVVYGPGRDRGLTAGVTLAIKAALLDQDYEIGFSGTANMQYADDTAKGFVHCALKEPDGASAFNMLGEVLNVSQMIQVIKEIVPSSKSKITAIEKINPMANHVDDTGIQTLIGPFPRTSFRDGAVRTADFFRRLLEEGWLQKE